MSFIGTAIFGATTTATVTAGAALIGAGASVYGAVTAGGGGAGGFTPSSKIQMTPAGKTLETSLAKSLKTDMFPQNLASKFLGDAKKMAQARRKISTRAITSAGATGPESVVTGNIGRGLLAETSMRFEDAPVGQRKVGRFKRAFSLERLNKLQNFINLQSGTAVVQAQADLLREESDQATGARRGAAIGSIAQLAAAGYTLR